jgi:hypothetical protein
MLATAAGYTLKEIDELTTDDTRKLFRYWQMNPPAHLILAAVHLKKRSDPEPLSGSTEQELLQAGIMKFKSKLNG